MTTTHPLRPLGLAVSLRLNHPEDLLAELRELPRPEGRGRLALEAMRAAVALARTALAFQSGSDPLEAVRSPDFRRESLKAAAALRSVVTLPWPDVSDEDRARAQAAYADFAAGLDLMFRGNVIRPDVRNFLTNITKAIGTIEGHRIIWTFSTLPTFA